MARTLLDMAKSLERRAARVSDFGNEAKKRKVLAAIRYLAYNTPVDESTALSNWQVGIGTAPRAKRGAFFLGKHGSTKALSAEATVLWAQEMLKQSKAGWPVYIVNLAPYIRILNDGTHSAQPGGFVEAAQTIIRTTA